MSRRLNFGPYSKVGGLSFEEYVLNALNRIEKWSYDVSTRFDDTSEAAATSLLTLETSTDDLFVKESGTMLTLES